MTFKKIIQSLLFILSLIAFANAKDTLNIAISPIAPHVIIEGDSISGFDIELMNQIAEGSNIHLQYSNSESLKQLFHKIQTGESDAAMAGLTLTEGRMKDFKYSTPYASSNIGILSQSGSDIDISRSLYVLITDYSSLLLSYALFVIVASFIMYLSELKSNGFDDEFLKGIGNSLYFVNTTITTTGYGDFTPKRPIAKVFTVILFYVGIGFSGLTISVITNVIQNESSSPHISKLSDIHSKTKVASVKNTTSETLTQQLKAQTSYAANINEALLMLEAKKVEAVIFDKSSLLYLSKNSDDLQVLAEDLSHDQLGVLFNNHTSDSLINQINLELYRLKANGSYDKLHKKHFKQP
jgi:polar amino acid transport system substrate-binding protein